MSDEEEQDSEWLFTGGHGVITTVEYRGVSVSLTQGEDEEEGLCFGYRYVMGNDYVDDALPVGLKAPTEETLHERWYTLAQTYEDEIDETIKATYPWEEGDQGFWYGQVVTIVGPFDQGYLYVKDKNGERITTIASEVSPVAPARKHPTLG